MDVYIHYTENLYRVVPDVPIQTHTWHFLRAHLSCIHLEDKREFLKLLNKCPYM